MGSWTEGQARDQAAGMGRPLELYVLNLAIGKVRQVTRGFWADQLSGPA